MAFAALIPVLAPLLPGIINGVEKLFNGGNGQKKKDIAIEMANGALKKLREQGVFSGAEGAKETADLVETVFEVMKSEGTLKEIKEGAPPAERDVVITGRIQYA